MGRPQFQERLAFPRGARLICEAACPALAAAKLAAGVGASGVRGVTTGAVRAKRLRLGQLPPGRTHVHASVAGYAIVVTCDQVEPIERACGLFGNSVQNAGQLVE